MSSVGLVHTSEQTVGNSRTFEKKSLLTGANANMKAFRSWFSCWSRADADRVRSASETVRLAENREQRVETGTCIDVCSLDNLVAEKGNSRFSPFRAWAPKLRRTDAEAGILKISS